MARLSLGGLGWPSLLLVLNSGFGKELEEDGVSLGLMRVARRLLVCSY